MSVAWLQDFTPRNAQSPNEELASFRLFASGFLSAEEKTALGSIVSSSRKLGTGRDLMRQHESAANLCFITEGWACRYTITRDGGRHLPALLVPGDLANPDSLLFARLGYGVRTLTPVTVVEMPRDRVLELADQHCGIARAFTWLSLIENAVLVERALSLGRRSARGRLAHLLCELAVRLGADGDRPCYVFPLTQEHIADALGLTPVHVNRTIQQLRADGLVEIKSRTLVIPDAVALRQVAGFDPGYLLCDQNRHDNPRHVHQPVNPNHSFASANAF